MRFILKHDTIENWERVNPVLMEAEIVSVKEDGFYSLALGDGTNPFKKLPRIKLQEGLSLKLVHYGNGRIRIRAIEDTFREEEKILAKEEKTMSDNYTVINGKKSELSEEQLKTPGIEVETKRKNPFDEVNRFEDYYFVEKNNEVHAYMKTDSSVDDQMYISANYFNDRAFAEQVALHQLLYRKLLKFSYDNECEDTAEWDGNSSHWVIRYNDNLNKLDAYCQNGYKAQDVYFSSEKDAMRAIHEVVEPFVKEHPEFVW